MDGGVRVNGGVGVDGGVRVDGPDPPGRPARERRLRPRRLGRVVLNALVVLLVGAYFLLDARLDRTDAVEFHARKPTEGPGQDWLIAGYDRTAGGLRARKIMLLHISPGGHAPTLVDLPPDGHVPGRMTGTLAAALARGGPRSLVATVEKVTGISVERYAGIALGEIPGPAGLFAAADPGAPPDPLRLALIVPRAAGAVTLDEADHLHHLIRLVAVLYGLGGEITRVRIPIVRTATVPGAGPVVIWDTAKMGDLANALAVDGPPPAGLIAGGPAR